MSFVYPKISAAEPVSAAMQTPERRLGSSANEILEVRLTAIRFAADATNFYEFSSLDGSPLPAAAAGAHIDLLLPNELVRQYSLILPGSKPNIYVVGVKRDLQSRGGSAFIHDHLRVGQTLRISRPRNTFPLDESAPHSVLIAGGIGVTPIFSMVERLKALGHSYTFFYACRTRSELLFREALAEDSSASIHIDDETGELLDLAAIVAASPPGTHFYCCGPTAMLRAFEGATSGWPSSWVHVEYFSPKHEAAAEGGFAVELARSGRRLEIPPGKTILDMLREVGIDAPSACEQGLCGACETRVISGQPDHRDSILSQKERAESKTMMICCSGAKSELLVLDL